MNRFMLALALLAMVALVIIALTTYAVFQNTLAH